MKNVFKVKAMLRIAGIIALAALIVFSMVACDNGTTSGVDGVRPLTGDIVPGSSLAGKLEWLRTNAESNKSYIIELEADETTRPIFIAGFNYGDNRYELNQGKEFVDFAERPNITIGIRGVGANRTISTSSNGCIIEISSDITLILDNNITLKGTGNNDDHLVYVWSQATLVMNPGSAITGSSRVGVYLSSWDIESTFIMNGGTITGNTATRGDRLFDEVFVASSRGLASSFSKTGGTVDKVYIQSNNEKAKARSTTAGPKDNLSYSFSTGAFTGKWDE